MHRVTNSSRVANGDAARIITHSTENSSKVEVNGRVYINVKDRVKPSASTQSTLTQRNKDSMKFSWDPIQVVNLSRQQKAVCTRELTRLSHLQRHFARQSHIENSKQTYQIDKYRQRLVRLNRLRMLEGDLYNSQRSPAQNIVSYRDIGKVPRASIYTKRHQPIEKSSDFNNTLQEILTDKKQLGTNNATIKPSVKQSNNASYITPSLAVGSSRVLVLRDSNNLGSGTTQFSYNTQQRASFIPYQRYQKADKQLQCGLVAENSVDNRDSNKTDLINSAEQIRKSGNLITVSCDYSNRHLPKLNGSDKKKCVKFSEDLDTVFQIGDTSTRTVAKRNRQEIKAFERMANLSKHFDSAK